MTNRNHLDIPADAYQALCDTFERHASIKEVLLFGSRALGTHRNNSDIDLCLRGEQLSLSDLLKIENEIDDLLLPWKVDLILYHTIDNPKLLLHVQSFGKKIYCLR